MFTFYRIGRICCYIQQQDYYIYLLQDAFYLIGQQD